MYETDYAIVKTISTHTVVHAKLIAINITQIRVGMHNSFTVLLLASSESNKPQILFKVLRINLQILHLVSG